jgi:hypothetical protein
MKTIVRAKGLGTAIILSALATASGCESVGIIDRDNIARSRYDRRDNDRRDRVDRDSRRDQIYGTVQDVDERRREIRVRENDGRTMVVRYDNNTRIAGRDREIRPDALRSGDEVSIRLEKGASGEQYADAIRVEDRGNRAWSR